MLARTHGYAGFSYAESAESLDISKATIHHHFPTKEDLGVALIEAYAARYAAALSLNDGAILLESPDHGLRKLSLEGSSQSWGCLCGVMAGERDILPQRLQQGIAQFFGRHLVWLQHAVESGIANGTLRGEMHPASQAKLILSALEGAALLGRLFGSKGRV